jgi:GT2 family glycosyltransferase
MSNNIPLVSVVTINYNNKADTVDFLRSIRQYCGYPELEVIVVDNGSSEDPSACCKEVFPGVRILLTGRNLGFSGGNNAGIGIARGEYIFFVNNDTEFTPGLLEKLVRVFADHPDAGLVSPKFHYFFHRGTIEYAGFCAVDPFTGRNRAIGAGEVDKGQYDQFRETAYPHGGGMMISRKVLNVVGPMPEQFFLYYEELDWSEQVRRKGFKIYVEPGALLYHKESMTVGKASPLKTYYQTRSRILFMRRNVKWYQFIGFSLFLIVFTIPKNTATYLFRGEFTHLKNFWKGVLWHLFPSLTYKS